MSAIRSSLKGGLRRLSGSSGSHGSHGSHGSSPSSPCASSFKKNRTPAVSGVSSRSASASGSDSEGEQHEQQFGLRSSDSNSSNSDGDGGERRSVNTAAKAIKRRRRKASDAATTPTTASTTATSTSAAAAPRHTTAGNHASSASSSPVSGRRDHSHNHSSDSGEKTVCCPKHSDFLETTFGPALAGSSMLYDFSCYYESGGLRPAHLFVTERYLCFHTLRSKSADSARDVQASVSVRWEDICNIRKCNTARIVPNAIEIECINERAPDGSLTGSGTTTQSGKSRQSGRYFFAFLNRHSCFKVLHRAWVGYDHKKGCTHEHTHGHEIISSLQASKPARTASDRPQRRAEAGEESSRNFEGHGDDDGHDDDAPDNTPSANALSDTPRRIAKAGSRRVLHVRSVSDVDADFLRPVTDRSIYVDYDFSEIIGKGAFSEVYLVCEKASGEKFAVKAIDKHRVALDKREMLDREVDILKRIQHKNIISVRRIFENETHLYLVMELAHGGELFEEIVRRKKYSERDAAAIIKQVASACDYLHEKGIVHRDLKPENLLLANSLQPDDPMIPVVKIADFGLSKIMDAQTMMKTACGTPAYVAPEVLMGNGYDEKVDVWSLGVIAYILLCGFPPFFSRSNDNAELFEKIMNGEYTFLRPYWDPISAEAQDLIMKMLVVDPEDRYSTSDVMLHPFVRNADSASEIDISSALTELQKTSQEQLSTGTYATSSVVRIAQNSGHSLAHSLPF